MNRFRVYCDFNHRIDDQTFGLDKLGTKADLARQQLTLEEGMLVTLCDHDTSDDGASEWLVADAVVVRIPDGGWAARVANGSFRHEPRREHDVSIQWTERQLELGLPATLYAVHPAWLKTEARTDGWSLACQFMLAPSEQGTPSTGTVHFVATDAPHHELKAGATLLWFEPDTGQRCTVHVLD
jgi:hypothetical protein